MKQDVEDGSIGEKFITMSLDAQQAYIAALECTDDEGRIPQVMPGQISQIIGVDLTPNKMLMLITEWLVMRLARLVVDEDGHQYIELDNVTMGDYQQGAVALWERAS